MKPQKRKTPGKKETRHKPAQAKGTAQQNQPLDPVLMGEYREAATQTWQASKTAFPSRFDSPQAWDQWRAAVTQQYAVYKKYHPLLFLSQPGTSDTKYGWDFRRDVELLRGGDQTKLEAAIAFLEADPWFHGSGYDKVRFVRYIKPPMLSPSDVARLQNVVLGMVERRNGTDFSAFCRLAKKVDNADLREHLARQVDQDDFDVRRRAQWVLEALAQKDSIEAAKKAHDKK